MATHLSFMAEQVDSSAHVLMKAIKAAQRHIGGTTQPHVLALQTEHVIISGSNKEIRRVFVKTTDSGEYFNVGWILANDLDNCMICNAEFGVLTSKNHCRGCGNLVCSKCSPETGKFNHYIV